MIRKQSKLTNDRDADSSEADSTSCNSECSTDLDVSSPCDRNNEVHNQDTSSGDQLSRRNATSQQAGIQSPHLGNRRSKRKRIEDEDETNAELENGNSQLAAGLDIQPTLDKSGKPTSQQLEGLDIGEDERASRAIAISSTRQRQVAKLPHRPSKVMDHPHNKESDRFVELNLDLRLKVQKIADVETLEWARQYLSLKRSQSLHVSNKANENISRQTGCLNTVETSDQWLRELRDHIIRDGKAEKSHKVSTRMALVSKRLHLAQLTSRFLEEDDAWKASPRKRRKPNEIRLSPKDRFVNVLFPETMKYKGEHVNKEKKAERLAAEEKFDRWIRIGKPWARMAQRYGYFIFLLIPEELSTENFRRLPRPHIELFLDYIDFTRPGLKDQLSHLSLPLLGIVNYEVLPPQRLVLETLPHGRLSGVGDRPLEELLQYCDEDQNAIELAPGIVPDCPPEAPGQLSSPLTTMDGVTLSDSELDFSDFVHPLSPDVTWVGDCEIRLDTAAIKARDNMRLNFREKSHPSQASHLDKQFLLSPMAISRCQL